MHPALLPLLVALAAEPPTPTSLPVRPLPEKLAHSLPQDGVLHPASSGTSCAFLVPGEKRLLVWRRGEIENLLLPETTPEIGDIRSVAWDDTTDRVAILGGPPLTAPRVFLLSGTQWVTTPQFEGQPSQIRAARGSVFLAVMPTRPPSSDEKTAAGSPKSQPQAAAERWLELASPSGRSWRQLTVSPISKIVEDQSRNTSAQARSHSEWAPQYGELVSWSASFLVPRKDGRYWLVNRHGGDVTLLSRSGSTDWKGTLPGVEPRGWSDDEKTALLGLIQKKTGQRPEGFRFSTFRPVIQDATTVDDNLLVLADSTAGRRLMVMSAVDNRVTTHDLPSPFTALAATEDGFIVVGPPWGTLSWDDLRPPVGAGPEPGEPH